MNTCYSCAKSYAVPTNDFCDDFGGTVLLCRPDGDERVQEAGIPCLKYQREVRNLSPLKACVKCGSTEWYKKNKSGHLECRNCKAERAKIWRQSNKAKANACSKNWKIRNPEKIKKIMANWYLGNSEKVKSAKKEWCLNNLEKVKSNTQNRRSMMKNAEGEFSGIYIKNLILLQKSKCAVCKTDISKNYHVDHIQPLSKGGTNYPENIQLLCKTCNLQKHAKDPLEFMQSKGFLI